MRFEKDIYHMSYAPVFTSMHQQACISPHQSAPACISMRHHASPSISHDSASDSSPRPLTTTIQT